MASNNSSEMKPLKGGTKMPKSKLNLHPSEKERAQELRDLTDKKNFKLYNTAKGIFYLFVSLYGLHYWEVYHNLIYHPEVRHAWVKLTVALSIAILGIKSYVELYEGKHRKVRVSYDNFRQATHAILILFLVASFSINYALFPVYKGRTFMVTFLFGYGVLLQSMLIMPVYAQNLIWSVSLIFFCQQYK